MDSYNYNCKAERLIALGVLWFCVGVSGVIEVLLLVAG